MNKKIKYFFLIIILLSFSFLLSLNSLENESYSVLFNLRIGQNFIDNHQLTDLNQVFPSGYIGTPHSSSLLYDTAVYLFFKFFCQNLNVLILIIKALIILILNFLIFKIIDNSRKFIILIIILFFYLIKYPELLNMNEYLIFSVFYIIFFGLIINKRYDSIWLLFLIWANFNTFYPIGIFVLFLLLIILPIKYSKKITVLSLSFLMTFINCNNIYSINNYIIVYNFFFKFYEAGYFYTLNFQQYYLILALVIALVLKIKITKFAVDNIDIFFIVSSFCLIILHNEFKLLFLIIMLYYFFYDLNIRIFTGKIFLNIMFIILFIIIIFFNNIDFSKLKQPHISDATNKYLSEISEKSAGRNNILLCYGQGFSNIFFELKNNCQYIIDLDRIFLFDGVISKDIINIGEHNSEFN